MTILFSLVIHNDAEIWTLHLISQLTDAYVFTAVPCFSVNMSNGNDLMDHGLDLTIRIPAVENGVDPFPQGPYGSVRQDEVLTILYPAIETVY